MAKSPGAARCRSAPQEAIVVRAASELDMAAVRSIYAHYVLHSLATFEETPPTLTKCWRAAKPLSAAICLIWWPKWEAKS
jgi:L-amino acid N-acyltransferase YncA